MVATEGRVKILDFGLAKQTAARSVAGDETIMVDQTEPGMIVGTISYMSPEQARGKPADYRSDQFSFGLVLYEMATGRKASTRDESVQTMSAIIARGAAADRGRAAGAAAMGDRSLPGQGCGGPLRIVARSRCASSATFAITCPRSH